MWGTKSAKLQQTTRKRVRTHGNTVDRSCLHAAVAGGGAQGPSPHLVERGGVDALVRQFRVRHVPWCTCTHGFIGRVNASAHFVLGSRARIRTRVCGSAGQQATHRTQKLPLCCNGDAHFGTDNHGRVTMFNENSREKEVATRTARRSAGNDNCEGRRHMLQYSTCGCNLAAVHALIAKVAVTQTTNTRTIARTRQPKFSRTSNTRRGCR